MRITKWNYNKIMEGNIFNIKMKTYKIIKTNGSNHKTGLVNLTLSEAQEWLADLELDYEKHPVRFKIVEEKPCN